MNAQKADSIITKPATSLQVKKINLSESLYKLNETNRRIKSLILPTAFIAYGFVYLENDGLQTLDHNTKIEIEEQLVSPNVVKVVSDKSGKALYFSRSPIPHVRNSATNEWLSKHTFYKHIGMYAYRTDILEEITKLEISSLEKVESLEQLRWLENGYSIKVAETKFETIGIDTPDDLEKAILFLKKTGQD